MTGSVSFLLILDIFLTRSCFLSVTIKATSLAPDIQGTMPIMARVLKTLAQFKNGPFLADQEAALQYVAQQHKEMKTNNKNESKENHHPRRSSKTSTSHRTSTGNSSSSSSRRRHNKASKRQSQQQQQSVAAAAAAPSSAPPNFHYIITRPTLLLRDGPSSTKKLAASRSQPGPVPVTYVDLAEFTLNALRCDKLWNTCPYVVADTFWKEKKKNNNEKHTYCNVLQSMRLTESAVKKNETSWRGEMNEMEYKMCLDVFIVACISILDVIV